MAWVKDVYRDEIRSGFLVTAHRKRIWDIELNMLAELERICEKYHLRYFAAWGTLLGAVRHGGFVPWDDDMDLVMMRPDYERLKEVAAQELAEPYFFQTAYTDGALFGIARLRNSATMAMLPKSVTSAIGYEISKKIGAITEISMVFIVICGIIGYSVGELIFKITVSSSFTRE